jgi:hypothetical protein
MPARVPAEEEDLAALKNELQAPRPVISSMFNQTKVDRATIDQPQDATQRKVKSVVRQYSAKKNVIRVRLQVLVPERIERLVIAEIIQRKERGRRGRGVADRSSVVADAIEKVYGYLLKDKTIEEDSKVAGE